MMKRFTILLLCQGLLAGAVWAQPVQPEQRAVFSLQGLSGTPVWNEAGEEVGKIRDVLVDVQQRRLAYAIVTAGGVLGLGQREYIVPWNAMQSDQRGTAFTVQVPELLRTPEATIENVMDREYFGYEVHRFYGVAPYWEEEPAATERESLPQPPEREEPALNGREGTGEG